MADGVISLNQVVSNCLVKMSEGLMKIRSEGMSQGKLITIQFEMPVAELDEENVCDRQSRQIASKSSGIHEICSNGRS